MPALRKYPPELRERAQRLVVEARAEDPDLSLNQAVLRIGPRVGVVPDTLRSWCKQAAIDRGEWPDDDQRRRANQGAVAGEPRAEARQRDLAGGVEFLCAGARPASAVVVEFIDENRDRFGVEPICCVLTEHEVKIAPSSYYAAKTRPASARACRDELLTAEIQRIFHHRDLGRGLAGARKMWRLLRRENAEAAFGPIARCTVDDGSAAISPTKSRQYRIYDGSAVTKRYTKPAALAIVEDSGYFLGFPTYIGTQDTGVLVASLTSPAA